jgi:hypothetical protein
MGASVLDVIRANTANIANTKNTDRLVRIQYDISISNPASINLKIYMTKVQQVGECMPELGQVT